MQNIKNQTATEIIEQIEAPVSAKKSIPLDKRLLDIAICLGLLIVFGPIMVVAAIAIRVGSKGPIIFKQERIGLNGAPFTIYKFRTMRTDMTDDIHRKFMEKVIKKQIEKTGTQTVFKMKNDPRITFIGKVLRKTSLDELPQIFNVLKGDMSIIGPRPPIAYEVALYTAHQRRRLEGLPGITGWWQVNGRNHTDFNTMVNLDIEYIEKRTLLMDLQIVFKTVPAMLMGY